MAKYGPHHDEINRFLSHIKSLTESDWSAASKASALASASFGSRSYHAVERELEAYREFGVAGANNLVKQALDDAGIGRPGNASAKDLAEKQSLVVEALHGLFFATKLSAVDFTRAYLPFQDRIPVEKLGFTNAPRVLAAQATIEGRFATRVLALDASDWEDALVISQFVDDITEPGAVDETWEQFTVRAAAVGAEQASSLNTALELLEEVGKEHLLKMSNIYQGMARVISRDDWIEPRMQQHRDEVEAVRRMATRALIALAFLGEIDQRDFATFYAPFGALIPVASLIV